MKLIKFLTSSFFIYLITVSTVFGKALPPGSGVGDVPANVLILLDKSGSMGWRMSGGVNSLFQPHDTAVDSNGDLYVSMPVPEDERYWVVHVHNNNTNVAFKINNLDIASDTYEFLITKDENTISPINTIKTTEKGTVFWRLLVNTAEEISTLDKQRRSTVCEYR